jgi:hypothetical protein
MGTTIPTKFDGIPSLTPDKIDTITQWYHSALGDMDKASDMDDAAYYWGGSDMAESILSLLHEAVEAAKVASKASNGNLKRAVLITGAVGIGYLYFKNKTKVHVFVEAKKTVVTDSIHKMDEGFKAKDKVKEKANDTQINHEIEDLRDDKIGDPTDD